jgi:hypothetical protein
MNEKTDPVLKCLDIARIELQKPEFVQVLHLLSNGKIEIPLKYLISGLWMKEGTTARRHCVMDKDFNGAQIDLLALESVSAGNTAPGNLQPVFWMETKCNFAAKPDETEKAVSGNVKQFLRILKAVDSEQWPRPRVSTSEEVETFRSVWQCEGYIVHFLNSLPSEVGIPLPEYINMKFSPDCEPRRKRKQPKIPKDCLTAAALNKLYEKEFDLRRKDAQWLEPYTTRYWARTLLERPSLGVAIINFSRCKPTVQIP